MMKNSNGLAVKIDSESWSLNIPHFQKHEKALNNLFKIDNE